MRYRVEKTYRNTDLETVQIYFYENDNAKSCIFFEKNFYNNEMYLDIDYNDFTENVKYNIFDILNVYIINGEIKNLIKGLILYSTECKVNI